MYNIPYMKAQTIYALASAPFKSALAIIRISGEESINIVNNIFSKDLNKYKENKIINGDILDKNEVVDNVVLLLYHAPKSFTGENSIEIICHGSMLIVNQIMLLLNRNGARQAEGGEFSKRAFLNKKFDLIQAESIQDLIDARTNEAKHLAMLSLKGETSKQFLPIKKDIEDLICEIEVHFDYPEEVEDIQLSYSDVINKINNVLLKVDELLSTSKKGKIIKDGVNVAIVGKPNVGKSSLLNALINEEKAIVTPIAGTTRDIVEGEINCNGIILHLLDTAGIRQSDDLVENIGVNKSKQSIDASDIVIVVLDANSQLDDYDKEILKLSENKKRIIVYNKSDISNKNSNNISNLYISALNKEIEPLKNEILKILNINANDFETPSLTNARQQGLLEQIKYYLNLAKEDASNLKPMDLVSINITNAYECSLNLVGETCDLDIAGEIFKRFCVGK